MIAYVLWLHTVYTQIDDLLLCHIFLLIHGGSCTMFVLFSLSVLVDEIDALVVMVITHIQGGKTFTESSFPSFAWE